MRFNPRMGDDINVAGASSSPHPKREQDAPATLWEFLDPHAEIEVRSGGNLPHWEQGSVWYFVTFRLADSLPDSIVNELRAQRELWKQNHDVNSLARDDVVEYYRLFSERINNLLNAGYGSCVLADKTNAQIVEDALQFFNTKRYVLDEYVIMPNHVHVLVKPLGDFGLPAILHSWKSFTAKQINKRMGSVGQVWQHESYDHIVRHERAMNAIRLYIQNNPKGK